MTGFFNHNRAYNPKENKTFLIYATSNDLPDLKKLFDRTQITSQDANNILDVYHNNLLHIATMNKNPTMVHFLLKRGINPNKKNQFSITPWEQALNLQHTSTLQEYINHQIDTISEPLKASHAQCHRKIQDLTSEIATLTSLVEMHKSSESTIRQLLDENNTCTKINSKLEEEITSLRQTRKRLNDELDTLTYHNSVIRNENEDLIRENKKLKISVNNLIDQNRKK